MVKAISEFRHYILLPVFIALHMLLQAQPVITNVSPYSAIPGSSITITGTGFNTTPANNIVYFGAAHGTVTAASATSLAVTLPVGSTHNNATVTNTANALTGYYGSPFLPTYDNSPYASDIIHFADSVNFPVDTTPLRLAIHDFDGDNKPELVVGFQSSVDMACLGGISVYRNTSTPGSLSLSDRINYCTGGVNDMGTADIDGDGKTDLVLYVGNTATAVTIMRNTSLPGVVSFAAPISYGGFSTWTATAIKDFDGDGKPDIAIFIQSPWKLSIFRNTSTVGSISFAPRVDITSVIMNDIVAADIDGDNKPELIGAADGSNDVVVYRNTCTSGVISFASDYTFPVGVDPARVSVGDIDGDGKTDLAVTNRFSSNVSILRNTSTSGTISFDSKVDVAVGVFPVGLSIGDINGDGKPDISVINSVSNTVSALRNTSTVGNVSFATHTDMPTGPGPWLVVVGDIDGDSKPDMAATCHKFNSVTHTHTNTFSIYRNDPYYKISGPTSVCLGGTIILTDVNAGGTWSSDNTVVASVGASNGIVTGASAGTANITYTFPGGTDMTSVIVTVVTTPDAGTITGTLTMMEGTYALLTDMATGGVWSSSNTAVATVGTEGMVTGISGGTTVISYAVTNPCGTFYATATVTVNIQPPVITNVGPISGIPGATVTITGIGFNATPTNNIVFFGATKATVTGGTTTSITVTEPVGSTYREVSVTNQEKNLTGYSKLSFLPTYDTTPYITDIIHFEDPITFTCDTFPNSIVMQDLDNDGKADLIIGTKGDYDPGTGIISKLSIYPNTSISGTISLGGRIDFSIPGTVNHVCTSDIDGDGKPDIMLALPKKICLLRNISSSGIIDFAPVIVIDTTNPNFYVYAIDLNGDGKPDIVRNDGNSHFSIYKNTSSAGIISFGPRSDYTTGQWLRELELGDIDGDNKPDITIIHATPSQIYSIIFFKNTSTTETISFATGVSFPALPIVHTPPGGVLKIVDIDGDNLLDIVSQTSPLDTFSVWLNTSSAGNVSLGERVDFASTVGDMISVGDINGDSKADIAIQGPLIANVVKVIRNTSTPGVVSFAPEVGIPTVERTSRIAVGDLDGDHKPDLAVSMARTNGITGEKISKVSLYRNDPYFKIIGPSSVCLGSSAPFANGTAGGTWSSGNLSVATVGFSSGIVTGMHAGTTRISYTFPDGSNVTSVIVTVVTTPVVGAMSGSGLVCAGATTTLSNTVGGGTWVSSTPSVATVGTNGVVTGIVAGTSTISYTITNACGSVFASAIVTVNAATIPGPITGTASVCVGNSTTLANSISGGTWSSSDITVATVNTSGVVTGVTVGTCITTYTVTTGSCANYAIKTMTVTAGISPNTGNATVCLGGTILLSNSTTGGTWSSSNPAKATVIPGTGLVTAVSIGTSNISYTISSGCYSLTQVSVNLLLDGSISGSDLCMGAPGAFTHPIPGGTWSSSNPAVATVNALTGVVTGIAIGVATITYTVGSCYRTKTINVNALGGPGTDVITGSSNVCLGSTTVITGPETGLAWSSNNTGVATIGITSGMVTGISVGTVVMTFFYIHGCMFLTKAMNVMPLPTPITGITTLCQGNTTLLASAGTPGGTWVSGDLSSISIDPASGLAYALAGGTSDITYTWTNTCLQMATVTVNPTPVIIAIVGPGIIAAGGSALLAPSTPGGTWATSEPAVAMLTPAGSAACIITGVSVGNVVITYTYTNGCGTRTVNRIFYVAPHKPGVAVDDIQKQIDIYPNPTSGKCTIATTVPGVLRICTMDGRFVKEFEIPSVSTNITLPHSMAAGIYMCRFNGDDGSKVMVRLVVER